MAISLFNGPSDVGPISMKFLRSNVAHSQYDYGTADAYVRSHWQRGDAVIAAGRPNWVEQGIGEKLTYWMTYHQSYVLLYVFEKNAQLVDTQFGVPVILNDEQLVRDIDVHPRILVDHLGRQHLLLPTGGTGHPGVSVQAGRERGVHLRVPGHQLPGRPGPPGGPEAAMRRRRSAPGSRGGWLVAGLALAVAIVAVVLNAVNPGGPVPRSRPLPTPPGCPPAPGHRPMPGSLLVARYTCSWPGHGRGRV